MVATDGGAPFARHAIALTVRNDGDGSAFFVTGTVAGPGIDEPVAMDFGNVGSRTPGGLRVGIDHVLQTFDWDPAACDDEQPLFAVELADRVGNAWAFDVEGVSPCGVDDVYRTDMWGQEAGCCCTTGGGLDPGHGALVAVVLAAVRRLRSRACRLHPSGSPIADRCLSR